MRGRRIHLEGFASQRRLDAGQFDQVLELQAALIYGAVTKLLQETLEGVSDSKTIKPVPSLDVMTM